MDKKREIIIPIRYNAVAPFSKGKALVVLEPYPEPFISIPGASS
ncbi:MAG: WG repeat-containing protein [Saprospiraceae bacterium]